MRKILASFAAALLLAPALAFAQAQDYIVLSYRNGIFVPYTMYLGRNGGQDGNLTFYNATGNAATALGPNSANSGFKIGSIVVGPGPVAGAQTVLVGDANAMATATTANQTTAMGWNVLQSITTGTGNTAFGYGTLSAATTGAGNTAIGFQAMGTGIVTGVGFNSSVGYNSLNSLTSGTHNVGIGASSLAFVTSGNFNVGVGYATGAGGVANTQVTTDSNLTLIGEGATKNNAGALTNSTAIGNAAQVTASNQVSIGNASVTQTQLHGQIAAAPGGAPTCSASCGTSPTVVGSDTAMIVTMGAAGVPASPFTITFSAAWPAAPSCNAIAAKTGMIAGKAPILAVPSTTTVIITTNGTAPANSDVYSIQCFGVQ